MEADQLFDEYIETATELRAFTSTTTCHLCTLGADKVRDHCHVTGKYRETAHSSCNSMCRLSKSGWKLPVVIHKFYDGHLIVKVLKSELANSSLLTLSSLLTRVWTVSL